MELVGSLWPHHFIIIRLRFLQRVFILSGTTTSEDERINHRRPVPPIIPNARAIYSSEDRTTLRFQCANGYILTKAKTDEIFNGEVIFDGEDWNPYPLPVCRAIIEEHGKPWNDSACGTGQHQINISPERSAQHAPNADKGLEYSITFF